MSQILKLRTIPPLIVIILMAHSPTLAQTPREIRALLGKPSKCGEAECYKIEPSLTATVSYSQGNIAMVVFEDGRDISLPDGVFTIPTVKYGDLVAKLIPLNKRGKKIPNDSMIAMNCTERFTDEYEAVVITYFYTCSRGQYRNVIIKWKTTPSGKVNPERGA